jgi:thermolysin
MMTKYRTLSLTVALCIVLTLSSWPALSQGQKDSDTRTQSPPSGKIVNSYRKEQNVPQPAWVNDALSRSMTHLAQKGNESGLANPQAELTLFGADQDDLGQTHVRLNQVYRGLPVFGGQLITHLDVTEVGSVDQRKSDFVTGRVFPAARLVNTTPAISSAQAIEIAKAALAYKGKFAKESTAELVILPRAAKESRDVPGAALTYKVELVILDGSPATADHLYFVNAHNGQIEWHYDNLQRGTGNSMYSGVVGIGTTFNGSTFTMQDNSRGGLFTTDMFDQFAGDFAVGSIFTDPDDNWGDGTRFNRQTAGVDAHFAAEMTWDFYLNRYGRFGLDNNGFQMLSRTHYGSNYNNAFWLDDSRRVSFGDGDGLSFNPLVSVDIVGHEWTHGLTFFTARLVYANQSGGSNESFSDIFGTMVEFQVGINPDYMIGEDAYTPGTPGDALRYMFNPRADGFSIDHFSQYFDGIDPHSSSGLQNIAFYLLAESGVHPTSGVSVKRIGRDQAAAVYFKALTIYLGPSATFLDVRSACEQGTRELYSTGNPIFNAVRRSWFACGVGGDVPFNAIDDAGSFVTQHYRDFLLHDPDPGGLNFWTGQITQCGNDAWCEDGRRVNVSRAFWDSGEFQGRADVQSSGLLNPPGSPRPYDNHQFVRWCYLNYLLREPDPGGWNFWEGQLNGHGDYNAIIRAFLCSTEYRQRFGTP